MDIQVFSDLHFEAQAEFDIPKTEAEVIVLAGDIGEGLDGVHWAIRQANQLEKPVLYDFGNHEHYQHSFPGLITEAKLLTQGTRVHVLERNRYIHGQTRFLGCTLWTDFQLFGTEQKLLFSRTRLIDLKSGEDPFFCQLSIEVQFHVAGSLELLEDYLIHTAARINKRRSYYGKTAALLDVSSSAKESLGMMQGRRVDTARKGAP